MRTERYLTIIDLHCLRMFQKVAPVVTVRSITMTSFKMTKHGVKDGWILFVVTTIAMHGSAKKRMSQRMN